jgi:hypothetical protein
VLKKIIRIQREFLGVELGEVGRLVG